jgi:hypothetical protein
MPSKLIFCFCLCLTMAGQALAEERQVWGSVNREDTDGIIEADEYRLISVDGGTTRRPCPYTCEMRGIERKNCREWRSVNGRECYVRDMRSPIETMPHDTASERARFHVYE